MKTKFFLLLSSFVILGLSQQGRADTEAYYTDVSPSDSAGPQYITTGTPPAPPEHERVREREHEHHRSGFSIGIGIDDSHVAYSTDAAYTTVEVVPGHRHRYHRTPLQWVDMVRGQPLPPGAVLGGNQPVPPYNLYVCRGEYQDGVHPGKIVAAGFCNISYDGDEVSLPTYQVLVSNVRLGWVPASYGHIPMNAVAGGYEADSTLYICKARYHGGDQTGKVVGQNCNISWNGREITIPHYQVLVM
jgi:hypothetical protein